MAASASPPLRSWFLREPNNDPACTKIRISSKPNLSLGKIGGEFMWLMRVLWEDGHELFLMRLPDVIDELERLVQTEPKAKSLMLSYVADNIADLAITTEVMRQLRIYQSWAASFEDQMVDFKDDIEEEFAKTAQPWGILLKATEGPYHDNILALGDPSDGRYNYPIAKRRSKEIFEAMRNAEAPLDAFWGAVDQNLQATAGHKVEGTALRKLLAQPRALTRTSEWVEPQSKKVNDVVESLQNPLSELYFDLERRSERTVDRGSANKASTKKVKTRGVARPVADGNDEPPPEATEDCQPMFYVDARAFKVFRTLFYNPSLNATLGEVPWTDFLHAMVATGSVPQKLYGSIWQFQPTKLDVARSIQFNEPHPASKLPYRTTRRFGRRLERAYG